MITVKTNKAPTPGDYSQALKVDIGYGWVVQTAGQTGNLPPMIDKDEPVIAGGIGPQTRQTLKNLEAVLEAAGADWKNVYKTTVFLEDLGGNKPGFDVAYKEFFRERGIKNLPARSTVGVARVPLATEPTLVEIDAVAYIPKIC